MSEPERTLRKFPESNSSIPARYARAYAWHKSAYPQKALAEVEGLLATNPDDPYFLELEGQVLLESGRPEEAIPPLRKAVTNSRSQPLISAPLGHADRKSDVSGKSVSVRVDIGGRRIQKK